MGKIDDQLKCWELTKESKMKFGIIEIGSNNTKTHVYDADSKIYEQNTTIEFKANFKGNKISNFDLDKLYAVIGNCKKFTDNIYLYGCSIFRNISAGELALINNELHKKFGLNMNVVSQEEESLLTAYGCYSEINFDGNICIFIGGGGSMEILIVQGGKIIEQKFFNFGVVDVTKKFESLKNDIPSTPFKEVYEYINRLIPEFENKCEVLILAGGDHLYWYNNARFKLSENTIYKSKTQQYLITREQNDEYDKAAFEKSLDEIRNNSDNPKWFDGSRAMKVITNVVSHKVNAKYIIPTKVNMEDGLRARIIQESTLHFS